MSDWYTTLHHHQESQCKRNSDFLLSNNRAAQHAASGAPPIQLLYSFSNLLYGWSASPIRPAQRRGRQRKWREMKTQKLTVRQGAWCAVFCHLKVPYYMVFHQFNTAVRSPKTLYSNHIAPNPSLVLNFSWLKVAQLSSPDRAVSVPAPLNANELRLSTPTWSSLACYSLSGRGCLF